MIKLWRTLVHSGDRHYATVSEKRNNRVLNLLLLTNLIGNFVLNIVELVIYYFLLKIDFDRFLPYFFYFSIPSIAYYIIVIAVFVLKNKYGKNYYSMISAIAYSTFILCLCLFLGPQLGFHLILFSLLPSALISYSQGQRVEIWIHSAIKLVFFAAALVIYELFPPLFPIPDHIAKISSYLIWAAAILIMFMYSIYNWRQVNKTEALLQAEKKHTESLLHEAIPKLQLAEAKYRHLVDESGDMIFLLDATGIILSMNKSCKGMTGFSPPEMIGKTIIDFIPFSDNQIVDLNKNLVREQFTEFVESKDTAEIRTTLIVKHNYDPIDVTIRLRKNHSESGVEIFATASTVYKDMSDLFIERERARFTIGNNVTHAEILSRKLTERLDRYFKSPIVKNMRIGLREVIINAIEHGNLGITFDEKTHETENGDYMKFLLRRQSDAKYAGRKVHVDYAIGQRLAYFRITDGGDGFDHAKFTKNLEPDKSNEDLEHGRGIFITRQIFDVCRYNAKGNEVILIKYIEA